jgi:Condensation domain
MKPTTSLTVRVDGARHGSSDMTWGQLAIWQWHGVDRENEEFRFNNAQWYKLPDGCTVDSIVDAVERVVRQHDALRTVFHNVDGTWRQVIEESGNVAIDVYDTDSENESKVADVVAGQMSATSWSVKHWPVRLAIIRADQRADFLILTSNRLAVDGHSMNSVAELMGRLASAGGKEPATLWQPLDEAAFERSPQGQEISDRALQHWRASLCEAPPSIFDFPPFEAETMRFRMMEMQSPAIGRAVQALQARWRTSPAALLLAATTVVLSRYTGHRSISAHLMAWNRMDRARRELVGTVAGQGLYHLDLEELSFDLLTRSTFRASGAAQRFAFCDPRAVTALLEDITVARGAYVDLATYINELVAYDEEPDPECTEQELRELAGKTVIRDGGGSPVNPVKLDIRFHLTFKHGAFIPLSLICDTAYVPTEMMRQFMYGMERVLMAAANGQTDVAALSELSEMTPVRRGPSWRQCGDGWVDVEASRRLWREVNTPVPATLLTETSAGGGLRLVGYVAAPVPPDLTDLHRRCVTALARRSDVRTPEWYRWVGALPAPASDHALWRQAPVLAEGDGRPAPSRAVETASGAARSAR